MTEVASWSNGLLGAVKSNGVSIEIGSGLNFIAPLSATLNPTTNLIEITGLSNFDPPFLGEDFRIEVPNLKDTIGIALLCSNITPATGADQIQRSPAVALLGSIWDGSASQYSTAGWYTTGIAGNPITARAALLVGAAGLNIDPLVAFDYNNSGTEGILWNNARPIQWSQTTRASGLDAFDCTFIAQGVGGGNASGAGFNFNCTGASGTTKNGGAVKVDLGAATSGGTPGFMRVRLAGNPGYLLASTGFGTNPSLYVGTETLKSEQAGSVIAVAADGGGGSTPGGIVSWCHGGTVAELALARTQGTRSVPTTLGSSDFIGAIVPWGYDGAAMVTGAAIFFQCDGTISSGSIPTKIVFATGTSGNGVVRGTLSNTGAQTWAAASGASHSWTIGSNPASLYLNSGGALYCGDTIVSSEQAGSIVAISIAGAAQRGLISWQHSASTAGPRFVGLKSRGTRSSPSAVAINDVICDLEAFGYAGATGGYANRGAAFFAIDATVVDGATPTLPTAFQVWTGAGTIAQRMVIASTGGQSHVIDSGATAAWSIGGTTVLSLSISTDVFIVFPGTLTTWLTGNTVSSGTGAGVNYKAGDHSGTGATNTAGAATFTGGGATGSSTNTHTGGGVLVAGGACTNAGAAGTFTGGTCTVRGGDVTGASGTRTGGDLVLRGGTGGTANGNVLIRDNATNRIQINGTGIGFFAATPVAQPSTTGETVGFTAGVGTAVKDDSTFTGNVGTKAYRISDIVKHLKNLGLIAAS